MNTNFFDFNKLQIVDNNHNIQLSYTHPTINFSPSQILSIYGIKFIDDIELLYKNDTSLNLRLIKIFFSYNKYKIKNIDIEDIPSIINSIKSFYPKYSNKTILLLLNKFINSDKEWNNIF